MNNLRRSLALLPLALLAACGGGGDAGPAPAPGTAGGAGGGSAGAGATTGAVVFKLNASTCNSSRNMRFFITGKQVGAETLLGGQSSRAYVANTGANEWAADAIDVAGRQTASWLGRVTVPAGGQVEVLLDCQLKR